MRLILAAMLLVSGCTLELSGLEDDGDDAGVDPSVDAGEAREDAGPLPPGVDGGPGVDSGPGTDSGLVEDGGPGPMDAGGDDAGPGGPPPGTELWRRLGPDYNPDDFRQSANMHFEGSEIHVPGMCRDLEMVTIDEPSSSGWTNYEVSVVRLRFDDTCMSDPSFTIVARTVSREATCAGATGYGCQVDFDDDLIRVGRTDGSCGFAPGANTMPTGSVNTGEQYTLAIRVVGNQVRCTFDNGTMTMAAYTDAASTHLTGGVAFVFDDVDARFGDPSVIAR